MVQSWSKAAQRNRNGQQGLADSLPIDGRTSFSPDIQQLENRKNFFMEKVVKAVLSSDGGLRCVEVVLEDVA